MPGKILQNNVINNKFSKKDLIQLKIYDEIIFVYDTDTNNTLTLDENIFLIRKYYPNQTIYHLQSVKTIENEIERSSACLDHIFDLFNVKTIKDYKKEFCQCTNLNDKLKRISINPRILWKTKPNNLFEKYNDTKCADYLLKDFRKM